MGIGKLVEEVVGAVAAEKAAVALNPEVGIVGKTVAAIAGFEGGKKLHEKMQQSADAADDAAADATDTTR